MVRTFLAIDLPDSILKAIGTIIQSWRLRGANVRWIVPERMHLTLKFLGEVEANLIPLIIERCESVSINTTEFSLELGETGVFPTAKRPRILWIGIYGDTKALCILQEGIEDTLAGIGIPRDERPFVPHLTVGRIRSQRGIHRLIGPFLRTEIPLISFRVTSLSLYKSTLTPKGPVYELLGRCPLAAVT